MNQTMGPDSGLISVPIAARFSRASALWRSVIFGGFFLILILMFALMAPDHFNDMLKYSSKIDQKPWDLQSESFAILFLSILIAMSSYHLTKLFRRHPRILLDEKGIRGPKLPGLFLPWSAIRAIRMSSGQRGGMSYATWHIDLQDGNNLTIRGMGILDIPSSDLFECVRGKLETGVLTPPPKRFWSKLWA